jgi:hypothetical protein
MNLKKTSLILISLLLLILISGCAPGSGASTEKDPAGFFFGIWHGWIAPITLIWSLFNPEIRIYEPLNTGWWYDFGFYMAVIGGFGSLSLIRKTKKGNKM